MKATETEADSEERLRLIAKLSGLWDEPSGCVADYFDATLDVPTRWVKRACIKLQHKQERPTAPELRAACLFEIRDARCYFQGKSLDASSSEDAELTFAEAYELGLSHLMMPKRFASPMQRRQGA